MGVVSVREAYLSCFSRQTIIMQVKLDTLVSIILPKIQRVYTLTSFAPVIT